MELGVREGLLGLKAWMFWDLECRDTRTVTVHLSEGMETFDNRPRFLKSHFGFVHRCWVYFLDGRSLSETCVGRQKAAGQKGGLTGVGGAGISGYVRLHVRSCRTYQFRFMRRKYFAKG